MPVRILTIPFDAENEIFQDEELSRFVLNKRVKGMRAEFFSVNGRPFWTVFVEYETVLNERQDPEAGLDEAQRLLWQRLREWRKEKADKEGVPVYIIAKNSQLVELVHRNPPTLEALRQIRGFGKKKVDKYGKELVELIQGFYEKRPVHHGKPSAKNVQQATSEGQAT